jgi:hypothetical protein
MPLGSEAFVADTVQRKYVQHPNCYAVLLRIRVTYKLIRRKNNPNCYALLSDYCVSKEHFTTATTLELELH